MNFVINGVGFAFAIVVTAALLARHQAHQIDYDQVRQQRQWQPHPELPQFDFSPASIDAYLLALPEDWRRQWQQPNNRKNFVEGLVRAFPTTLTAPELKRIQRLIEKTLPSPEGKALSELAIPFFQYRMAFAELSQQGVSLEQRYQRTLALQQQYFSKQQQQALFQRSNELTLYLLERQRIQQQTDWSEAEKQRALKALHQDFNKPLVDQAQEQP